jgi:hypothetical protein
MVRTVLVFIHVISAMLQVSLIAMGSAAGAGCLAALPRFGRRTSQGSMVTA